MNHNVQDLDRKTRNVRGYRVRDLGNGIRALARLVRDLEKRIRTHDLVPRMRKKMCMKTVATF